MLSKPIFQIIFSVLFIALFAQLSIHIPIGVSDIPITGQTYAVLLIAYLLPKKIGTLAVLVYVILGTLGLPVFADGKAGWDVLTGGSGGFLIGFIAGAFVVGSLGEKDKGKSFFKSLLAMSIGTIIILIFGIGWLSYLYGFAKGLEFGFYPFWQGAIVKIILGAITLQIYFYLIKKKSF